MSVDLLAYPDWTEYKKKSGLDPLGMQNSSINLYQRLLPGISNVTLRMRYYGFYAWLASIYAHRIVDTNPKTWQKFVRRAEAVYALAAQRRGNEGGMAGVQWAQRKLEADQEPNRLSVSAALVLWPASFLCLRISHPIRDRFTRRQIDISA
jgi:hypothetical protein